MFKSSDLSPAGPCIIAHQSAAERATFEMAEVKLSSGEYSIFNNTSSRAKSNVWEAFGVILDGENNQHPRLFEPNMQLRVLIIARFHCLYICGFGSGCGSCAGGSGRVAELIGNMCQYFFIRKYRYTAYRQFVRWCWGVLGPKIRVPLPACAVTEIRKIYPEPGGRYQGFQWPNL